MTASLTTLIGSSVVDRWCTIGTPPACQPDSRPRNQLLAKDSAKILIVDDSATDREFLSNLLRHSHYQVMEASDGAEALHLARAEHPDLVICDVVLPKMNGYEFVRQLQADHSIAGISVIFYTGYFSKGDAKNLARDCSVSLVLSKPTDAEKILRSVSEVLTGSGTPNPNTGKSVPEHFDDRHHQLLTEKILEQTEALRMTEDRFRLLAENATDMIFRFRLSPGRMWEYVNPASQSILGYGPNDFYEDPELLLKIVHPESYEKLLGYIGNKPYQASHAPIRFFHKNGATVWAGISINSVIDDSGNMVAFEGIARDITERIEMNEEIHRSRDELELRVQERTCELERVNTELREFTFIASHDLKEPLRKIRAFADQLRRKCADFLNDEAADYVARMQNAASRMQDLLEDLLLYSQVNVTQENFTEVDLTKTICEVAGDLSVVVEKTGGTVTVSDLPAIEANETQMRQLFQNLIGNSLKYHGAEKPVVNIYSPECGHDWCTVVVEDNGIGFDEQYLDRIFLPFHRLHGRSSGYEGTGIGLAICRKIVERHNGKISARSTPGRGSSFIVRLPLRQDKGPTANCESAVTN